MLSRLLMRSLLRKNRNMLKKLNSLEQELDKQLLEFKQSDSKTRIELDKLQSREKKFLRDNQFPKVADKFEALVRQEVEITRNFEDSQKRFDEALGRKSRLESDLEQIRQRRTTLELERERVDGEQSKISQEASQAEELEREELKKKLSQIELQLQELAKQEKELESDYEEAEIDYSKYEKRKKKEEIGNQLKNIKDARQAAESLLQKLEEEKNTAIELQLKAEQENSDLKFQLERKILDIEKKETELNRINEILNSRIPKNQLAELRQQIIKRSKYSFACALLFAISGAAIVLIGLGILPLHRIYYSQPAQPNSSDVKLNANALSIELIIKATTSIMTAFAAFYGSAKLFSIYGECKREEIKMHDELSQILEKDKNDKRTSQRVLRDLERLPENIKQVEDIRKIIIELRTEHTQSDFGENF